MFAHKMGVGIACILIVSLDILQIIIIARMCQSMWGTQFVLMFLISETHVIDPY